MKLKERMKSNYSSHWQSEMHWMGKATTLKVAADKIFVVWINACHRFENLEDGRPIDDYIITIWEEIELFPVYMLLMGYAFENLVKGIIISEMRRNDPEFIDKTNLSDLELPWKDGIGKCKITIHEFKYLFKTKFWNMDLPNQELRLLEEIDEYIIWGGKYPVPKKFNGSFIGKMGIIVMDYDRHQKPINALYDKLWTKLNEANIVP